MYKLAWEEFWWDNITGPHTIVTMVAKFLIEKNMVALCVPSDLPWRHQMRSAIELNFKQKSDSDSIIIETIDVTDECEEDIDPGKFLLKRFASQTSQIEYRAKAGVLIQDYFIQKGVLKDRIIWIKGLDSNRAAVWLNFCKKYNANTINDGLFVLELHGYINVSDSKRLKVIEYSNYVNEYDVQLFNSFALDEQVKYSDKWKKYIAAVSAQLCGVDAEVSEKLLQTTDYKSEDPIIALQRIAETREFCRRGCGDDVNHVLSCVRLENTYELKKRIWSAQVQVLFPIIELERVVIVNLWKTDLEVSLRENEIYQYGQRIFTSIDAELGTINYIMSHRNLSGDYIFFIPDESIRKRIQLLHECRNLIAHANCCSAQQIDKLFSHSFEA